MLNSILLIIIIILLSVILGLYINNMRKPEREQLSFNDTFSILNIIINSEFEEYERDVFTKKDSITNSNFEAFYTDLSKKIIDDISDFELEQLTLYIPETAVYKFVARRVKEYLTSKIYTDV